MVGGKVVLKTFLKDMIKEKGISKMFDYEDSGICFSGQHIDGGICYFLWDREHTSDHMQYFYQPANGQRFETKRALGNSSSEIVVRDFRRQSIITKTSDTKILFKEIVSLTQPFGVRKDLFNSPDRYPNSNLQFEPFDSSVKIYGVKGIKGGAKRIIGYVNQSTITKNVKYLEKYKLFFTTSYSTNAINPPEAIIGEVNSACTETFLIIGPFDSEFEQHNCHRYIKTTFFKTLLFFGRGTMQVSKSVFRFIPLQDFTTKSDIDWSKSIAEIDKQLYVKYQLSAEEVAFIESMIKPME